MAVDIAAELGGIMDEYIQEVQDVVNEEAKAAAEATAGDLKANSPKRDKGRGKGKYARGWKVKKKTDGVLTSYVVYNGANPGLTHPLEHGHIVKNQYGSYGRAKAVPHIKPAEEQGVERFVRSVKERLER